MVTVTQPTCPRKPENNFNDSHTMKVVGTEIHYSTIPVAPSSHDDIIIVYQCQYDLAVVYTVTPIPHPET